MFDQEERIVDTCYLVKPEPRVSSSFNKRAMDVVLGTLLFLTVLPLMAMIALIIMVRDGAPVLYVHHRIGRDGKPFGCLKFRTMVRDSKLRLDDLLANDHLANAEWNETQKLRNDPRILPWIGPLLRSSSLDELPQLWNVIKGDMSLVGPRPIVEDELPRYGLAQNIYKSVRPGLTGVWQIGERSNDTYAERVRKDVTYVRTRSFAGDLKIIVKTAKVVLTGTSKGAY